MNKFRDFKPGTTVANFLLFYTDVESIVVIEDCGWQIGVTWIDHEDLFIQSFNTKLLNTSVKSAKMATRKWATEPVIVIDIGK